jgi:hypothetical protein
MPYLVTNVGNVMPVSGLAPVFFVAIAPYRFAVIGPGEGGGIMSAMKDTQRAISSTLEGAEDPCAVATITRLIHSLYASNAPSLAMCDIRDNDLLKWSEIIGAVRGG